MPHGAMSGDRSQKTAIAEEPMSRFELLAPVAVRSNPVDLSIKFARIAVTAVDSSELKNEALATSPAVAAMAAISAMSAAYHTLQLATSPVLRMYSMNAWPQMY